MYKQIQPPLSSFSFLLWLKWLLLFNTGLFLIIGLYYTNWVIPTHYDTYNTINKVLAWCYIIVTWIGHFTLLAFLPGILLLPLICLARLQRTVICLASFILALALFTLIVDAVVFSHYRFHLNGVIWEMLTSGVSNEIFDFSKTELGLATLVYIILVGIELCLSYYVWNKWPRLERLKHKGYFYTTPSICLLLSYLMFLLSAVQPHYASISQHPQAFPLYTAILSKLVPVSNSLDNLETIGNTQFRQPQKAIKPLHYPLNPLTCQPQAKPINILFIVIDAWRFDMLNKEVTPHLFQFAKQSLQFANHFSGGNSTQPGIFSLFYALPSTYWAAFLHERKGPAIIDVLLNQGYTMGIFGSASLAMPPFDKTVFSRVPNLKTKTPGDDALQRDKRITNDFIGFAKQQEQQPFFGFLFYDAPHSSCNIKKLTGPFQPMLQSCNRILLAKDSDPSLIVNRYKNTVYGVDHNIHRVLTALRKLSLLENTIIVITGDHGEEFNDAKNGYWGHSSNFSRFQTQTPLLIYWPKHKPQHYTHQTSHYDIVPTLLKDQLHCTNPLTDYTLGKSLFETRPADYLLIASYISYGIITPHQQITIYPTGNYKIDDNHGNPLKNATLDVTLLQRAMNDMNHFYRVDKKHGT